MATLDIIRHRSGRQGRETADSPDSDPITTEVIRHGLVAAAEQMKVTLRRTAFSPVIYEMTDFAAALYDSEIRLLAQAQALPHFLGTLSFCIESSVAKIGGVDALEPGDILFTTYGYDTGSHPQDATIIVPGFYNSQLVGYAAVKAHHLDIGAKEPYCTDTIDIFQEGTIFPSVKLFRRDVLQDDIYRTILANSRMPEALAGDLHAQIAAAHTGLAGYFRLIKRYGLNTVAASTERMMDHGEALVRSVFETIPDGRYVGTSALDNDGLDDEVIPFEIVVEVSGTDVVVDYSHAPDEAAGPVNCPVASSVSGARIALMIFAGGNQAANEGHFRPLEVRTRPGTLFHPVPPAPIYLYGFTVMQAVDAIHKALGQAVPHGVPAGTGGDLCAMVYWGKTEEGAFWTDGADHYIGQGASVDADGGAPLMHISVSGIRNSPIEVIETRRPILVEKAEYAQDSGGPGQHRGGLGIDLRYRALRDFYVTLPWERMKIAPWGLNGGRDGRAHRYHVENPDGSVIGPRKRTGLLIPAGATLELNTSGGGGFGPCEHRDASAVQSDVRDGYVSEAAAMRDYPHVFVTEAQGGRSGSDEQ
jgi:N-methylhydantoinase B